MAKLEMILHIFVRGLIVVGGPKVALALLFILILNMNFYTSKVDAHKTPKPHVWQLVFGTKESFQTFKWVLNDSSHPSSNQ
jgi:hypothetical protein